MRSPIFCTYSPVSTFKVSQVPSGKLRKTIVLSSFWLNVVVFDCSLLASKLVKIGVLTSIKDRFLTDTQWVYVEGNIIFSHAGISKTWFNNFAFEDINLLNNCEPSEEFGFTPDNSYDYYGNSITQPCVWIRPISLVQDALDGYIQVVGHTPVKKITNLKSVKDEWPEIWLCDCLPDEYLVIENNEFVIKKYNESS